MEAKEIIRKHIRNMAEIKEDVTDRMNDINNNINHPEFDVLVQIYRDCDRSISEQEHTLSLIVNEHI